MLPYLYYIASPLAICLSLACSVRHAIDNATISRKHLVIEVGLVKPGDGVRLDSLFSFDSR